MMTDITDLRYVKVGLYVVIETKRQEEVSGFVQKILSKTNDPKGIKVQLKNKVTGRIIAIPSKHEIERELFKFYNLFFHEPIFIGRHRQTKQFFFIDHPKGNILPLFSKSYPNEKPINPSYHWQLLSSSRWIQTLMKDQDPDFVYLNHERLIPYEEFKTLEKKFKEMP